MVAGPIEPEVAILLLSISMLALFHSNSRRRLEQGDECVPLTGGSATEPQPPCTADRSQYSTRQHSPGACKTKGAVKWAAAYQGLQYGN